MGKGFSQSDIIFGSDDSVNGYPYADQFGFPDDIGAPDWLTSVFSTDFNLQPGFATAIVLGEGFNPKLHLYDSTGFTYFKINDPNADDDAFGGLNSQTFFFADPGETYSAVVESLDLFPGESRNFYFEVQVDDAGNDLLTAKDLGDLSVTGSAFTEDFVGVSDATDYYKFDLSSAQTIDLLVGGLSGDVDVELLDSSGNFINGSFNGGTDAESIISSLGAGTYYIRTTAYNAGNQARAIASNDVASNYFLDVLLNGTTLPNRNPTDLILSNGGQPVDSIDENKPAGTVVGNFATVDPDDPSGTGTYTYSLVSGAGSADNGKFTLSSTGQLTANQPFDYEAAQKSYTIRVQTQDNQGGVYSKSFTINVRDVKVGDPNDPGATSAPTALA